MVRFLAYVKVRSSILLAVGLALAIAAGCERGETAKPKDVARPEATPKQDQEKETLPATPAEQPRETPRDGQPQPAAPQAKPGPRLSGREVLERMVAAYRKAPSYSDAGAVRLLAESGNDKLIDQTTPFSVAMERPNKLRLQCYQVSLICDGQTLHAALERVPNQVLARPAPAKIDMKVFRIDPNLAMSIGDFAGPPPQLLLLLSDDPMRDLLRGADEPVLAEPSQTEDGRDCYRVRIDWGKGAATFWIDQQTLVLRRIVFPTTDLRDALSRERPTDRVSLVAEFAGARLGGPVDPKAFGFEMPKGAESVTLFVPPHMGQLLAKPVPRFRFFDMDGQPVMPVQLMGKVVVLEFWATGYDPCRQSLPELEKVYQRYKNNPKVAIFAVSVDGPQAPNSELVKFAEGLKLTVPILRDKDRTACDFNMSDLLATFIFDAKGIVQDYEAGGEPAKRADMLAAKIDKVLAGQDIYGPLVKQYAQDLEQLKQDAKRLETSPADVPRGGETVVRQERLPEVKLAPRSQPSRLRLTPLWRCAEVKSPGNVLVVDDRKGPARILVVDNWDSVAEVGPGGQLVARYKLDLADKENVGRLCTGVGADGRRYVAAFFPTHQRCHVLDESGKLVGHFPEDALKNPHSGIADVQLGDLDGDGRLKMYVGYLGTVGVQAVPLPLEGGRRLWSNRSMQNVGTLAIGAADQRRRRELYCTNNNGSLLALDAEGRRQGEVFVPKRMLGWVATADLRGDGQALWCGLAASQLGENTAVGFSIRGDELWSYALPQGVYPGPIELVIPGRVTRDGPGQWLLPGPDGSIHILSADGRLLDKFNYGAALQGLATIEIGGRPVLVVASPGGLEAWRVE
jgi:peroxiredoxin